MTHDTLLLLLLMLRKALAISNWQLGPWQQHFDRLKLNGHRHVVIVLFKELATALNTEVHCAHLAIFLDLFHIGRTQVGGRAAVCRSSTNIDHFQEAGRDGGDLENLQREKGRLWGCCDPGADKKTTPYVCKICWWSVWTNWNWQL